MKYILAWIRIILCSLLLLLGMSYLFLVDLLGLHTELHGFQVRRLYIRIVRWILGIRLEVVGKPIATPGLYVSNHRTLSDPLMTLDRLYAYVIAKHEVRSYPLLGKGASLTGTMFLKREDKDHRRAVRETIRDILRDGKNVLIYPEGTTNVKPFTGQFSKGSLEIAMELGVPIVPVTVEYRDMRDYWRQPKLLAQFIAQFGKWRSHVFIHFHKPFVTDNLNTALRRVQIEIDGDIAHYHGYDDHSISGHPESQ